MKRNINIIIFVCMAVYISSGCSENNIYRGICGNGVIEGGESCDGAEFRGLTCRDFDAGKPHGQLRCTDSCYIDVSGCVSELQPVCGNGVIDPGESCDGANLNGASCASIVPVRPEGELRCSPDCKYDLTDCRERKTSGSICGNGVIETGEQCDRREFNGASCASLVPERPLGYLSCNKSCKIDTSNCRESEIANHCGNGVIDPGEACDGANFNGASCADLAPERPGGFLKCFRDCRIDTSHCTVPQERPALCGNGVIDPGEACDGADHGGQTCQTFDPDYPFGELSCSADCSQLISRCHSGVIPEMCGLGSIDEASGIECDYADMPNITCAELDPSLPYGKVTCNFDYCRLSAAQCMQNPGDKCGNGQLDEGEQCDASIPYDVDRTMGMGDKTCEMLEPDLPRGRLKCSHCKIDTSGCYGASTCGNGTIESAGGEQCDGANLGGASCASINPVMPFGVLSCTEFCTFDTKNCSNRETAVCGDGIKQMNESCDGTDFGMQTCASYEPDRPYGDLVCNACMIDTSHCRANKDVVCGDGLIQGDEECDGDHLNHARCDDINPLWTKGSVSCNAQCRFDVSECRPGPDLGLQRAMPNAENTDALCSNHRNDHAYGSHYDCGNYYCSRSPLVQVCMTQENTDAACSDGIDMPRNGLTDCEDPSCYKNPRVRVCRDKVNVAWELGDDCLDGIDNDGDGRTDCEDLDCMHAGSPCPLNGRKRVLFDNAHHQTAGNADWVIDVTGRHPWPTVPQKETDWAGYYSAWGMSLIHTGKLVLETLIQDREITYGTDAVQDLKNYDVFISPEPSVNYSDDEIRAIYQFVQNGGGFVMITDHPGSDRDDNGWDSVKVFNDMLTMMTPLMQKENNPFGFSVMEEYVVKGTYQAVPTEEIHPITKGIAQVGCYSGGMFEIHDKNRVRVLTEVQTFSGNYPYMVVSEVGNGRVFAAGDTSIVSDTTNSLGYTETKHGDGAFVQYDNNQIMVNAVLWAAGLL